MPLTRRLAEIIGAMIDAKLDAESGVESSPECPDAGATKGPRGTQKPELRASAPARQGGQQRVPRQR
jgi:hypothetical protein